MKVLFLDHDGVICLLREYGSRFKKIRKQGIPRDVFKRDIPVSCRFDNFNKKAIKVLNQIITETDCEVVVSSDWRLSSTVEELGEYYESQGICKKPYDFTPIFDLGREKWKESRVAEINEWLSFHPQVTHWVAVDDLDLSALDNFVLSFESEGIKKKGLKQKIIDYLM